MNGSARWIDIVFSLSSERADADADAEEARSSIHGDDDDVHAVDPRCRRVIEASVSREDDEDSVSETKKISNCIPNDDDDDAVRGEREG